VFNQSTHKKLILGDFYFYLQIESWTSPENLFLEGPCKTTGCVNVGPRPIYWPLQTSHSLRRYLCKISLDYNPLHHIITDDNSFAHLLHGV